MATNINNECLATGEPHEVRMILLGKTGSGKSSLGNTILKPKTFKTGINPTSITKNCTCAAREFKGKRLFVVDTPGFLDTNLKPEELEEEVAKSYEMAASPGPHAFLLVLEPRRCTPEELETITYFTKLFPQACNHTIIIFTRGDEFVENDTNIEEFLGQLTADSRLKKLIEDCGNRYLSVNNKATEAEKETTVEVLLLMIANMITANNGRLYITAELEAVAQVIGKEKSQGTYHPFQSDGSFMLHPKTKEIVIEGFLRRTIGRKVIVMV